MQSWADATAELLIDQRRLVEEARAQLRSLEVETEGLEAALKAYLAAKGSGQGHNPPAERV